MTFQPAVPAVPHTPSQVRAWLLRVEPGKAGPEVGDQALMRHWAETWEGLVEAAQVYRPTGVEVSKAMALREQYGVEGVNLHALSRPQLVLLMKEIEDAVSPQE